MKRIVSLILAAAMLFGLSAAALAYEDTDPPKWERWGYENLEELLEDWGCTEEEYYDEIAYEVAIEREYPAWREEYLKENPSFRKVLIARYDPPVWAVYGYGSKAEFEENFLYGADTYENWLCETTLKDLFTAEWQHRRNLQSRPKWGGPEEGIGVMWNGEYVKFPDAQPRLINERTMVPVRAFMERVGAKVDYKNETVILSFDDGSEISFVPGRYIAAFKSAEGKESVIRMDSAPFLDDDTDRTYVPLRFFTEALGYDVSWDGAYETAIVTDRQAIIDDIDGDFTILNSALKSVSKEREGTYKSELTGKGKLTVFDSLNGDKTANFTLGGTAISDGEVTSVSVKWDASGAAEIYKDIIYVLNPNIIDDYGYGYGSGLSIAEAEALAQNIAVSYLEGIINLADGKAYLRSPALSCIAGLYYGDELDAEAWLSTDIEAVSLEDLGIDVPELTVGNIICALIDEEDGNSIFAHSHRVAMAKAMNEYFGDDRFAAVSGGKAVTVDLKAIADTDDEFTSAILGLTEAKLTFKALNGGGVEVTLSVNSSVTRYRAACYVSADSVKLTLNIHRRNAMELSAEVSARTEKTSEKPAGAPPEGDEIILTA